MRLRCLTANGLWLLGATPAAAAFDASLHRVAEVQEDLLLDILRRNARTPFGMAHRFGEIRSVRDYGQRVDVRTYDDADPLSGIAGPVERLEKTSGSSGPAKLIPVTRTLRRQFHAAIAPWICGLFSTEPRAFAGEAYWSVSPGAESDEELLGPLERRLVRAVQAVPSSVRLTADIESWRRETLAALLRCRNLSLISVWHPSFLQLLIPEDLDPVAAWPRLRVISCWADGNAAAAAGSVAQRFPHARVIPKGLLSTEGFVSIPFRGAHALTYRSHFYEFRDGHDVVLAHQLQTGRRYGVILTTGGGLYRYDTEDVVEVTGFAGQCPLLRFIGRANHVSDHFGEKLNEIFVREQMESALGGLPRELAMLACERSSYVLYVESAASDAALLRAAAALEASLRASHHYDYCRRLGQLAPLRLFRIARNGATAYLTARASTQTLGDIKIPALDRDQGWSARFEGRDVG